MRWVKRNEDKPHRCPECHAVATWERRRYGPRTRLTCPRTCGVQWRPASRMQVDGMRQGQYRKRMMREQWRQQLPDPVGLLRYWDKYGNEVDLFGWGELFEDWDYRCIGETYIGAYRVSTIWAGHDLSIGYGPYPLIFESMVFGGGPEADLDCRRYRSLADAEAGHEELVTLLRATVQTVEEVLEQDAPARKDET